MPFSPGIFSYCSYNKLPQSKWLKTPQSARESQSVMSDSLWPHGLYSPCNSPGQNTGVGSCSLLQGIFPTQRSSADLPHCRQILYQLSHQGSSRILEWVAYPFSRGFSHPRNWTGVSCNCRQILYQLSHQGSPKTQVSYSSGGYKSKMSLTSVRRTGSFWGLQGKIKSLSFSACRDCWHPLACGHSTQISTSTLTLPSLPSLLPSYKYPCDYIRPYYNISRNNPG